MGRLGAPEPFTHMPLHYGFAYGGTYRHPAEEGEEALALCDVSVAEIVGEQNHHYTY